MVSACDIGNPVYNRSGLAKKNGNGILTVVIFFSEDRFDLYDVAYQWNETPDGIEIEASVPEFAVQPSDLMTDLTIAFEEEFSQGISRINLLN